MKKISAVAAVALLLYSLTFSVGAAITQYNNKGFQLYPPENFIQDTAWAEKYGYVDYWHTEDYGIEMVLVDTDFPQGEFMEKHPDEPYYDCHIIHDEVYGYASSIISEEEIEINGNTGKKRTYKKEVKLSEDDGWERFSAVTYVFEKENKYYEVRFYIHNGAIYGFYPDMIMETFSISKYTSLYKLMYTGLRVLPFIAIAVVSALPLKKKFRKA